MIITVNRFCGIESKSINVDKLFIMEENNGYGKSSMLKAVNFCLSGVYPDNPIYNNGSVCQVDLTFDNITLSRVLKRTETGYINNVYINGTKCTQKVFEEWLSNNLVPGKVCKVLCNPLSLSEISEEDLGELIINVINKPICSEKIRELAGNMTDEQYKYLLELIGTSGLDKDSIDISDISTLYNTAYTQRQITNRQIKAYGVVQVPEPPVHTDTELQDKIYELSKKEAEQNIQRKNNEVYNNNVAKAKQINQKIADIETKLKQIGSNDYKGEDAATLTEKGRIISEKIIETEKQLSVFQTSKNSNLRLIAELDKTTCPLSDKIQCNANRADLKNSLAGECKELDDKISDALKEREHLYKERDNNAEALKAANIWENDEKNRLSLMEMLNTLKSNIPDITNMPEPVIEINYAEEKAKLQEEMRLINTYNDMKKKSKEVADLKHKSDVYSELINLLNPKGEIKRKFWELIISPLEDGMNNIISRLKNAKIKFDVSNGFKLLFSINDREFIKFNSLSGGEKIIATLSVYHVINKLYNNRLLLIDDLDRVDDETYTKTIDFINDIKNDYDAIICARVSHKDN